MQLQETEQNVFPLSKTRSIRGNRRLVREKTLQILVAYYVSNTETNVLFNHIFYRDFLLDEEKKEETSENQKLLSREEITEVLSDTLIDWKNEDIAFATSLMNHCLNNYELIISLIKEISENWEIDRIAPIDKTIIIMGATELINFPDIPIKATINEAIELSKKYSSEKSPAFINGLLEKIKKHFLEKGLINKSERGEK
ncbi:hypothetical protein SDC9_156643 [bioreactor metagenome]|uniref:NusB/RsmB/TIM44 domain-containing protein n=1 Tax=bioreactor metagenome TaxID=1076179 RepID=A0A645F9W1_9ZZZZ